MDIGTHALASLAMSRALFLGAPRLLWAFTIPAGVIADADAFSAFISPSAYLTWHRTYTHSLLVSLIIACILGAAYRMWASHDLISRLSARTVFVAVLLAQWLHLAMDAAQWQGVELFWPINPARIAMDWLPAIDPWIVTVLIAAIVLPEFFHLIGSEIGAKDKRPRGFVGAIVGLIMVASYIGLRAELHGMAIAQMQNRSYAGELPRQVAAFSDFVSLVTWHGVADTESAVREVTVHINSSRRSALDPGINLFKPEANPLLQAAEATEAANYFLRVARFPKATVQKMDTGTEVQIRDLRYAAAGEVKREPMVTVDFDPVGKIISEAVVWASREMAR
jgi:inner membrane protein